MKRVIRELELKEIKTFTEIVSTAYPGIKLTSQGEKIKDKQGFFIHTQNK
ncbi:MAG: hypothetical protein AB7T10_00940 [bacterium]